MNLPTACHGDPSPTLVNQSDKALGSSKEWGGSAPDIVWCLFNMAVHLKCCLSLHRKRRHQQHKYQLLSWIWQIYDCSGLLDQSCLPSSRDWSLSYGFFRARIFDLKDLVTVSAKNQAVCPLDKYLTVASCKWHIIDHEDVELMTEITFIFIVVVWAVCSGNQEESCFCVHNCC
jgi:hypothetical protein